MARKKERERENMRSWRRQLKAMLRKNWLLKIRHPFITCAEVFTFHTHTNKIALFMIRFMHIFVVMKYADCCFCMLPGWNFAKLRNLGLFSQFLIVIVFDVMDWGRGIYQSEVGDSHFYCV